MTDNDALDAYGHMNWTVGNEDWVACADARRVGDQIEYEIVVDCDSAGFVDTIESGSVPATLDGITDLLRFPGRYADMCCEQYTGTDPDDLDAYAGPIEWEETNRTWRNHLESLLAQEPGEEESDSGDDGAEESAHYEMLNRGYERDRL